MDSAESTKKYIYIVQVTRQLSIDIINHFSRQGAEIVLVTGVVESNYEALDSKVKVIKLNKYNSTSAVKRLFTWGLFTFYSFFYVLFNSRKKELVLVTTPPFIVFLGLFFKRLRNQKYHLIIWDLYPDVLVNFKVLKESSVVLSLWKSMNRRCFDRAETIFTLGKHIANAIKSYTFKEPVIVPNWVNANFIRPIEKHNNSFAQKYNLTNKFVVMYSGNLGATHDIESVVEAADVLKNNDRIAFVIIGEGAKKAKVEQFVKEKGLPNVLVLPLQPKEILPFSITSADVGVVTLEQGAENISVPSKTYYMLAASTAILALASEDSELGVLIKQYNCGEIINKPSAQKVADVILKFLSDKDKFQQYRANSRKASFDFTPNNAKLYYKYICAK